MEGPLEKRSAASSSWDLVRTGGIDTAPMPIGPYLAENLSAVFACVQIISETVATLPLVVYRTEGDRVRNASPSHPVARLFARGPNEWQTTPEWFETMTAQCLLRGNAFSEIVRDNRGAPAALIPHLPDNVTVYRIPRTDRIVYDVSDPSGGTRRLLAEEMLHLKDRADDPIMGKSRLSRARSVFSTVLDTEQHAAETYRGGARLSGVFTFPTVLTDEQRKGVKESFLDRVNSKFKMLVLEAGIKFEPISITPEDAELLAARRFGVEQIARLYGVPLPIIGELSNSTFSNVTELGRWFKQRTIIPWLEKWQARILRSLFSTADREAHQVEFDADDLERGDMLQRMQSYRIAREIGLYSANELRAFEKQNPRTDKEGETYLAPLNMMPEQAALPKDEA